ncbi:hypothetical protein [Paenibacillus sp. HB172176]|uniref:hypothetical protein n=1 Tax=Paenibacillus sp. HB172176 TaxID=2493690 RepID=UPI00143C3867|nr:hypothetical protein [Paenibacillus sp. HB172176]
MVERFPFKMLAVMLISIIVLSACSAKTNRAGNNKENEAERASIRAIGEATGGKFIIKPVGQVSEAELGAPSCLGRETDIMWSGTFQVIWEPKGNEADRSILTFPDDFTIVQPDNYPTNMKRITLGDIEILIYSPHYTDCHALETYFFGTTGNQAFPISITFEDGQVQDKIGRSPIHEIQSIGDELVIQGGYSAGDDAVERYHFRYDSRMKTLILENIDNVNPNQPNIAIDE